MDKLIISAVPITLLEIIYPLAVPHLQKAIDHAPDDTNIDVIKGELLSGSAMLMVVCDGPEVIAACYLETITFGTGLKVLYMPVIGGNRMDEWIDRLNEIINAIAIDAGCSEIRGIATRVGWSRVLKKLGWNRNHEILARPVKPIDSQSNIHEIKGRVQT